MVGGALLISVPVALILNEDFYGRGLARVIIMLPWAVSLTMTAIVWRWALNGESGMLNSALRGLGAHRRQHPVAGAAPATAFPMQILIGILVTVPFTTTIFLGGLSSIPDDLYEAAAHRGRQRRGQQFRAITLPLLKPFINIALVLNTIYVFNSFPIIWVMTQGGPANSTDILVTYLYKLAFRFGKLGEASAVSLRDVRDPAGLHDHLCAAGHARGGSRMSQAEARRSSPGWCCRRWWWSSCFPSR